MVVRDPAAVHAGDRLEIHVARGHLGARVLAHDADDVGDRDVGTVDG
jgi:hypothetical protein